ncbi:MAG TPA: hypothetical protein EYP52_02910 [Anaerolineae bacterium]|nr:hypothetical protein [Anaerolineae bacterium]
MKEERGEAVVTGAFVLFVIVLVIIGLFLGISLGNNWYRDERDRETRGSAPHARLERGPPPEERLLKMGLEIQREIQERDLAERRVQQQMELERFRERTLTAAWTFAIVVVSGSIAFYLVALGRQGWGDGWVRARELARKNEELERRIKKLQQEIYRQAVPAGGNGQEHRYAFPKRSGGGER